jgi:hypothetical protein
LEEHARFTMVSTLKGVRPSGHGKGNWSLSRCVGGRVGPASVLSNRPTLRFTYIN